MVCTLYAITTFKCVSVFNMFINFVGYIQAVKIKDHDS